MHANDRTSVTSLVLACMTALATLATLATLGGCSSSNSDTVVEGNFPVVFAKRSSAAIGSPTTSVTFAAGGDLMMIDIASPSATPVNLTAGYTKGKGDVSDPEVSYDGTRVLFSMRGPDDSTWNIFEMDLASKALHRIISDDNIANAGDDVDPAYLPDGRIVFVSNRQTRSKELMAANNTQPYSYLDEYDREPSTVLHVMNADGSDVHQISDNQSHDRDPTVLMDGEIMFARWDHLGARNHFPIFTVDPDGTNLFVKYGAFSPGNSFLHPREMPDGTVMSDLMPLSGTHEGGALIGIDVEDFSENDQPVAPGITGNGQQQLTLNQVNFDMRRGVAQYGRYTTPYPLWDGTHRALVSYTASRPIPSTDPMTGAPAKTEGPPLYGIYMFDIDKKTLRPVALPPSVPPGQNGWCYVDPVAVMPRPVPNVIPDKTLDANLASQGLAVIDVKSVYDTDFLDIMGESVLAPGESIPQTTPPPGDLRSSVADIAKLKDPAQTTAAQRPARFLRVLEAVPTPAGLTRETIGETDLEMETILGYTDIEPDGSFRILVPADTPIALSALDANGMSFQRHTNWLQLRPGETRTCDGCHSPRRGVPLNIAPIAGFHPNTVAKYAAASGESMAETRTRVDATTVTDPNDSSKTFSVAAARLVSDIEYQDVWTDPTQAGRPADPPISITYAGLQTPAPVSGVINFPDNIAPLFSVDRGPATCTACHGAAGVSPNLTNTPSGSGRLQSYESLTLGPVAFDSNGQPIINVEDDGELVVQRADALVQTGGSGDTSRTSLLFEKMLEKPLHGPALPAMTVDHRGMLNASELRVLTEWADVGGQYYNDPFNVAPGQPRTLDKIRSVVALSEDDYNNNVHPVLMAQCAGCHQAFGGNGGPTNPPNSSFKPNNFVLTGDLKGDYDVTLTMVTDVCHPAANPLLLRPVTFGISAFPHPAVGTAPLLHSVLAVGDSNYNTIYAWIASGSGQCP